MPGVPPSRAAPRAILYYLMLHHNMYILNKYMYGVHEALHVAKDPFTSPAAPLFPMDQREDPYGARGALHVAKYSCTQPS